MKSLFYGAIIALFQFHANCQEIESRHYMGVDSGIEPLKDELWQADPYFGPLRQQIIKESMLRIQGHLYDIEMELELIDWMLGGEKFDN